MKFLRNRKGLADIVIVAIVAASALAMWLVGPTVVKSVTGTNNQKKATHSVQSERVLYQVDPQHPDKLIPVKEKYSEQSFALDATEPPETLWQKFTKLGVMAVVIIVLLSYLGIWPVIVAWYKAKVKPKLEEAQTNLENLQEEKDILRGDTGLIVKSVDEGLAAMNTSIASAQSTYDTAQAALSSANALVDSTTDPSFKKAAITNAQISVSISQAVLVAVTNLKKEFLTAMSRKQDTTTKKLVAELKND